MSGETQRQTENSNTDSRGKLKVQLCPEPSSHELPLCISQQSPLPFPLYKKNCGGVPCMAGGIELLPPAVEGRSLNHCIIKEVLDSSLLILSEVVTQTPPSSIRLTA